MKVTKQSTFSGKMHTREIAVTPEQIERWRSGALIQQVMPNITADDREFLMTGMTPEEWTELFGVDDEND